MDTIYEIVKYTDSYYIDIKVMLGNCFSNEYKLDLTENQLATIYTDIIYQFNNKILFLDLLLKKSIAKGFVIYQIDSPSSDWCEKEGWGFIREIYIADDIRKKGFGQKMVLHAESVLKSLEIPNIYITADENRDFWIKMGYQDTGEVCQRNGGYIFTKS